MSFPRICLFVVGLALLITTSNDVGGHVQPPSRPSTSGRVRLPVLFEPNVGQLAKGLEYGARVGNDRIALHGTQVMVAHNSGEVTGVTAWRLSGAKRVPAALERAAARVNYLVRPLDAPLSFPTSVAFDGLGNLLASTASIGGSA